MNTPRIDGRTPNTVWAGVLVETLVRCGVTQAVISPGSRSTPLTLAFVAHAGIECIPVLDERSAGFFALGLARHQARPVVLVCTSGTAAANYFPAVIEAQESGVPLLVLTADRPPELRDCAAGQTIDQQKLYGGHVGFYHELALPEASRPLLRYLRATVAQACQRTFVPQRGPVHLNVPFRDPLAPVGVPDAVADEGLIDGRFFSGLAAAGDAPAPRVEIWRQGTKGKGIIVAGPEIPDDPAAYAQTVGRLATQLGWPVLADGVSPLRHHAPADGVVVTTYDTMLRNRTLADELAPEQVLVCGDWPTSKVLRQWLAAVDPEITQVRARHDNRDALHGRTQQVTAPVAALQVKVTHAADAAADYAARWRSLEEQAANGLRSELEAAGKFEGRLIPILAAALPRETPVFVASSMPVRDVEYFWPANDRRTRFFHNRGANGIDGTLSTALGMAQGGPPAVLLTGDLAFLHDSNGLLIAPKFRGSLTVLLINNHGGGIFEHLPVAALEPPFEQYFATPQQVDLARLCAAHGIAHERVADCARMCALCAELPPAGIRVLELVTDRKSAAAARKRIFAAVAAALV
ncbi:MAG: 2-succinyl-5-enolpyruvyl-6-hydroxy-3-cyclohexene-1-carboxylic-acid synthase [Opitutaceae bacterium]|nr:2-succinyl-5-enolpyruvyl-6-hydroxy-3-cyclohexene-1-carboxylic-acid synthase [Opitutaceae bacterium]